MTHVIDRLQRYVDGELPPADARAVEAHLQVCAACRDEHLALTTLWAQVESAASPVPALTVWPDLAGRMSRRRPRPASPWLRGGLAAAALCAGVLLGLRLDGDGGSRASTSAAEDEDAYLRTSATLDQIWWSIGAQDDLEVGS